MAGERSPPSKRLTGPASPRRSVCAPGSGPLFLRQTGLTRETDHVARFVVEIPAGENETRCTESATPPKQERAAADDPPGGRAARTAADAGFAGSPGPTAFAQQGGFRAQ